MSTSTKGKGKFPCAFATSSIGNSPADALPPKLDAIRKAGFTAIEFSFLDLIAYSSELLGGEVDTDDIVELSNVASEVGELCADNGLAVLSFQPFANFEGWPRKSQEQREAFTCAERWIGIMNALDTDILLIGANDESHEFLSPNLDDFVRDLRSLCDRLALHGKRLAYENRCWSPYAPSWKDAWNIITAVDRPNIGLCLDTFQIAGSEWGDPTTASGLIGDASIEALNEQFDRSMAELESTIPKERIYLLQISDAYKPLHPMKERSGELPPRARWNDDFRAMPYAGGYLPVETVVKAVVSTGFEGWLSMEVFESDAEEVGVEGLEEYAAQAMDSMQRLIYNCAEAEEHSPVVSAKGEDFEDFDLW